ncbi:MAG: hypothetical protein IJ041_10525 [Clostridia bacterium]|nr:hypothetical protein [Clostridia bacterium]
MPLVQYCKKCKTEVPLGESCVHCGGKLTKSNEMISFGVARTPVREWFCWNEWLRIILLLLGGMMLLVLLIETAAGGFGAARELLLGGLLGTMLILLAAALLLCYVLLRLQGGERIHYVLDKQGVHAWHYLNEADPVRLYARLLSPDSVARLAQDDHALPGLTLIRSQFIPWNEIRRVRIWRENAVLLLYRPNWWLTMFVNCPINEMEAVEKMLRLKLKPRKEVKEIRIQG